MPITPPATEISWQEFFRDERLQRIIATALNNNRDLRIAALNVERARGLYGVQRAELYPTLDAVGSGIKQRVPADPFRCRAKDHCGTVQCGSGDPFLGD